MSKLNRWLYLNRKKVNTDGNLNPDYINERLTKGIHQETIDDYALTLKAEYERLKLLDETEPESWINYTAYDCELSVEICTLLYPIQQLNFLAQLWHSRTYYYSEQHLRILNIFP